MDEFEQKLKFSVPFLGFFLGGMHLGHFLDLATKSDGRSDKWISAITLALVLGWLALPISYRLLRKHLSKVLPQ